MVFPSNRFTCTITIKSDDAQSAPRDYYFGRACRRLLQFLERCFLCATRQWMTNLIQSLLPKFRPYSVTARMLALPKFWPGIILILKNIYYHKTERGQLSQWFGEYILSQLTYRVALRAKLNAIFKESLESLITFRIPAEFSLVQSDSEVSLEYSELANTSIQSLAPKVILNEKRREEICWFGLIQSTLSPKETEIKKVRTIYFF